MNAHQRRIARRLQERAFFGTNEAADPTLHQSGYYQNAEGMVFHAHGRNMNQATIEALGELAKAAWEYVDSGKYDEEKGTGK
jgi:hypothetical protein